MSCPVHSCRRKVRSVCVLFKASHANGEQCVLTVGLAGSLAREQQEESSSSSAQQKKEKMSSNTLHRIGTRLYSRSFTVVFIILGAALHHAVVHLCTRVHTLRVGFDGILYYAFFRAIRWKRKKRRLPHNHTKEEIAKFFPVLSVPPPDLNIDDWIPGGDHA